MAFLKTLMQLCVKGALPHLQKYARGPETFAFLTFQYSMLEEASYFQQSWDQAALPSQNNTIYDAVGKLFAGQLNGTQVRGSA